MTVILPGSVEALGRTDHNGSKVGLGMRAAGVGASIGVATAALMALGDYGAHWLWLESASDRLQFLLRLLGTQLPAGALVGAVVGACLGLLAPALAAALLRQPRWGIRSEHAQHLAHTAVLGALCMPGAVTVAYLLFTGGKMSRLSMRPYLQPVTALLLVGLCLAAIYAGLRLLAWSQQASAPARGRAGLLSLGLGFGFTKLDQWILPNLYNYLHGVLTVLSFAVLALGLLLLLQRRLGPLLRAAGLPALLLSLLAGAVCLDTLEANQNVRVALLNPHASHSRSLLQWLSPALRPTTDGAQLASARAAARRAQAARQRRTIAAGMPVLENAHILLITIDALRADHLGMHGYGRATSPELDRLAQHAVVFDRAYAPAPHSSFSLSSLMTSEYLHETVDLGHPLPSSTLARVLGEAGYHTAGFYTDGIFHTQGDRLRDYRDDAYGFALHEHRNQAADLMTDRVLREIDRTVARGEPSSLTWVHYFDVHEPYEATTFGTADMDRYDSEILRVDGAVARLIREARERFSRDVIVAITADHGEEFRDHGGLYHGSTLYEEQVRVPLLLDIPGVPGRRIPAPVETIDLAPTLLSLVGVHPPNSMRGDDLRALSTGKLDSQGPAFSAVMHKRMVVHWPHKLIADLRFGLYELYDLQRDPRERRNLVDAQPHLFESLRGEIYAWLDSLSAPPSGASAPEPHRVALERGRLGDRRAVEPLSQIVIDPQRPTPVRRESARILGHLADRRSAQSLVNAMGTDNRLVGAEAAIALGRMYDKRARDALRKLVNTEDPDLRSRAAVSLGRLRDSAAVPGLIETLWVAPNKYEREEAVRWLGRLRDSRAIDPLIQLLPETRTRYLVVVALGQIGDERAFEPLRGVLSWEHHANIRDNVVRGLGLLDDPRALPVVVPLASREPLLKNTGESLVRLGAIDRGFIGGTDVGPQVPGLRGFADCHSGPLLHDWNYQHRTHCETRRSRASLRLALEAEVAQAQNGLLAVLSVRRTDQSQATNLHAEIGGRPVATLKIDGKWAEHRWKLPAHALEPGTLRVRLRAGEEHVRFAVDHLLLVPDHSQRLAGR